MVTRWTDFGLDFDPQFSALNDLRREMDRLFSDFQRDSGYAEPRPSPGNFRRTAWPRINVHDLGTELRLRAEVPGLTEKDLGVTVEQNSLTVRGERSADAPEGYSVHRQERGPLSFARSFTLPCRVDPEKVAANLKNGILEVTLPKLAEAQPKQIRVQAS